MRSPIFVRKLYSTRITLAWPSCKSWNGERATIKRNEISRDVNFLPDLKTRTLDFRSFKIKFNLHDDLEIFPLLVSIWRNCMNEIVIFSRRTTHCLRYTIEPLNLWTKREHSLDVVHAVTLHEEKFLDTIATRRQSILICKAISLTWSLSFIEHYRSFSRISLATFCFYDCILSLQSL